MEIRGGVEQRIKGGEKEIRERRVRERGEERGNRTGNWARKCSRQL
jgi:hypothetical protein